MTPCSKLRAPRFVHSASADKVFLDWALLDRDLVELIGWRLLAGDLQDYVRFHAVCCHWGASAAAQRPRCPRHTMKMIF